ncbi:hypothetical protein [Pseudomonas tolaasii]|nr:hypothetical protein [Pseudomonas tolaasii]WLH53776.1 hypothetical protein PSH62_09255 [Pseudomonas tolaasii]
MESSTLGMLVLTLIAVFGTASFCFEHLTTRQPRKKKLPGQIADEKKPAQ